MEPSSLSVARGAAVAFFAVAVALLAVARPVDAANTWILGAIGASCDTACSAASLPACHATSMARVSAAEFIRAVQATMLTDVGCSAFAPGDAAYYPGRAGGACFFSSSAASTCSASSATTSRYCCCSSTGCTLDGWYLSDPGESCTSKCSDTFSACSLTGTRSIVTPGIFNNVLALAAPELTCNVAPTDSDTASPRISLSGLDTTCALAKSVNPPTTCAAAGPSADTRVCCCSASTCSTVVSSGWFFGYEGQSCNSVCEGKESCDSASQNGLVHLLAFQAVVGVIPLNKPSCSTYAVAADGSPGAQGTACYTGSGSGSCKRVSSNKKMLCCCASRGCPIDCIVSDWGVWSSVCSADCDGGTVTRSRSILNEAFGDGETCPQLEEEQSCNTQPCPVDCEQDIWSEWTACTFSCGSGSQSRSRATLTPASNGGEPCGSTTDSRACNTDACPVDCVRFSWTAWGACSLLCGGGSQSRTAILTTPPSNGGFCELSQTQICNTQDCPVDCELDSWQPWTTCSLSCGTGSQSRTRAVITPATDGGAVCSSTTQTQVCNTASCPVDCIISSWNEWGTCSLTCGGGTQVREPVISSPSAFGGACESFQTQACNSHPCPVDCVLDAWQPWGACSTSCGGGLLERTRAEITPASNGGVACTPTLESFPCSPTPCPVDCLLDTWSLWTPCTLSCSGGMQSRSRSVLAPESLGGICGSLIAEQACNIQPCPVDCVLDIWVPWTSCSKTCGSGISTREREVLISASAGGVACSSVQESVPCNTFPCPVDCVVDAWTAWSSCPLSCNGGTQFRERSIVMFPDFGGVSCLDLGQTQTCNAEPCPVDCVLDSWQPWAACTVSCGGGAESRVRRVLTPASAGGVACDATADVRACNLQPCPIDCVMEIWGSWTTCSLSCNAGSQSRSRIVSVPASLGGVCGDLVASQTCNSQECPVDCELDMWAAWSSCSRSCGTGTTTRSRAVLKAAFAGGVECDHVNEDTECNGQPCPIDCTVDSWTTWTSCTASCAGGVQSRQRTTLVEPNFGGAACPSLTSTRDCNGQACPIDCIVSSWTEWAGCSVSCANGLQARVRHILEPAAFGGAPCYSFSDARACNPNPCPIDCLLSTWSAWTSCSVSCGGSTTNRTRSVVTDAQYEGVVCEHLAESVSCNTEECPIAEASFGESGSEIVVLVLCLLFLLFLVGVYLFVEAGKRRANKNRIAPSDSKAAPAYAPRPSTQRTSSSESIKIFSGSRPSTALAQVVESDL